MADQISGITGGLPGGGLGAISGTLQGGINNITNMGSSFLDKWFPPKTREEMKEKLTKFATEKPMLASFIFSQLAISGLPIILFIIMTITVIVFALLAGIIVGLVGALVFVVIALLFALFILLPTLFITTFFAVAVWLWGVGAYFIIKWFNEKKVPGIHIPLKDGLLEQTGLKGLPASQGTPLAGENEKAANGSAAPKREKSEKVHKTPKSEKAVPQPQTNGSANVKSEHHADGAKETDKEVQERHEKRAEAKKPKESKSSPNKAAQTVNDAGDAVGGLTGKITG